MAVENVLVPDLGDFDKVDIVEVLVAAGEAVERDASLITLESDKATLDVPSPHAGVVVEMKVRSGDQVATGDLILTLEVAAAPAETVDEASKEAAAEADAPTAGAGDSTGKGDNGEAAAAPATAASQPAAAPQPARAPVAPSPVLPVDEAAHRLAHASPTVRRFARELGVDLGQVRATGRKGRILKEDVKGFVKRELSSPSSAGGYALPPMPVIDFSVFGEIDRQPLSRIQKISGPSLQRSWLHVPHVTQHEEADVTELEAFRKAHSEAAKKEGFSLTPLAFVLRALVPMLREFPTLNSSLDPDGEHLIFKRYIHLGFAVDTPGGLLVPVIRDVDTKGISEIARELREMSGRAREGKLRLDEMKGASFTVTSLGGIGGTAFTPIVNAPEVAILGVSRTRVKPVWNGSEFEPRSMLPLSLSYDHRVVDGATAARATTYLSRVLTDIRTMLL